MDRMDTRIQVGEVQMSRQSPVLLRVAGIPETGMTAEENSSAVSQGILNTVVVPVNSDEVGHEHRYDLTGPT